MLGGGLAEDDLTAVFEKSRKKIFDSIVKYSRKELVAKHEIYPIGEVCEFGEWKITELGKERVRREGSSWAVTYAMHTGIVLVDPDQVT